MSSLCGNEFEERVDLQRRQRYHLALVDSLRFGAHEQRNPAAADQRDPRTGDGGVGSLGGVGLVVAAVAVLCCVYTVPAATLSAIAAFPVAFALKQATRGFSGKRVENFGGFYRAAWLGIFCYLSITAVFGIGFAIRYAPHTNLGVVSDFSASISYLRLKPALLVAIVGPGLLGCAATWSVRIGRPFTGLNGFFAAVVVSAACIPETLAVIGWSAMKLFD